MSEPEADALRIGDWVARAGLHGWLGDRWLGNADDLVLALAPRIAGPIDRRRLVREFDQIADTVAERLLALTGLAEHELHGAISAVSRTLDHAVLPERDRWDRHSPAQLARLISGGGTALPAHDAVLRATCVAVCEALSHLPPDVEEFTGLLREPGAIATVVGEAIARQQTSADDDVVARYRRFIAESMDRLELAGVRSRPTEYSLTEGFVAPSVQRPDTDGNHGLPFVQAVAQHRRLLVRGESGAGKTTALCWLAVRAARGDLPGLGQAIPLVVRLRGRSGSAADPVLRLAEAVVHPPDDRVSVGWIHRVLDNGTALLLVDGLDEISEPNRSRAWAWLRDLVAAFPSARMVVSTRPSALGKHEQDPRFDVVDLMPMTRADVDKFVRSWYRMVAPTDGGQARHERTLHDALAVNPHLGRLAASPTMCSLLCVLTMERATALPRNHEIYQAVLDMLMDRREPGRTGHRLVLGHLEKQVLLAQLAYWFLINRYVEVDRKAVLDRVKAELRNMPKVAGSPEEVLNALIETCGVLRESVVGRIDFTHQSLQDYLAARAVLDQDATGVLVQLAHEDRWREVVTMAAGQANRQVCERLIAGLLHRAEVDGHHRAFLLDIAEKCLAHRSDIRNSNLDQLKERIALIGPPTTDASHRVVIAIDIENFAAPMRTNAHQLALRGAMYEILQRAFRQVKCPWERCALIDSGDGVLVLAPAEETVHHLARRLPDRLVAGLLEYNAAHSAEARMRLRMSINEGMVRRDENGFVGTAVVNAARLIDSHAVRNALRESTGVLASVLSDSAYQQAEDRSGRYWPCTVEAKEFVTDAWVRVYGVDQKQHGPATMPVRLPKPGSALAEIINKTRINAHKRESTVTLATIQRQASRAAPPRDALAVLRAPGVGVIAEVVHRRAEEAETADPVWLARTLEDAGACVIGVPAAWRQSGGSGADLAVVRAAVSVPLFCTDYVVSPYQVSEARAHGADMVLLVAAALDQRVLVELLGLIESLGMTAVVQVQTTEEADRALEAGARVISITATHRNVPPLRRETFDNISAELPASVVRIAEGSICSAGDLQTYASAGADAVLIRSIQDATANPVETVRQLVAAGEHRWSHRT